MGVSAQLLATLVGAWGRSASVESFSSFSPAALQQGLFRGACTRTAGSLFARGQAVCLSATSTPAATESADYLENKEALKQVNYLLLLRLPLRVCDAMHVRRYPRAVTMRIHCRVHPYGVRRCR